MIVRYILFKIFKAVLLAILLLICCPAIAQFFSPAINNKTALLQVASGFYTVKSLAHVDLDSSLVISAQRYKVSRIPIIAENIEEDYSLKNCGWIDNGNVDSVEQALTHLHGFEHTRLSLLLGAYYAFHSGFDKRYTDLAIHHLIEAKIESDAQHNQKLSAQAAILLGKSYFKQNNIAQGKIWTSTVTGNKSITDNWILAKAWNYAGMYCPFLPETSGYRIACLNNALQLYEQLHDYGNAINTLMNIAYMSFASGKLQDANTAAAKSLSLQKSNGFPYQQYTYDLLSYISEVELKCPLQIKMELTAIDMAESTKDSFNFGHFYSNLATAYNSDQEEYEGSVWRLKALNAFEKYGGDVGLWILLFDLSDSGFFNEDPAKVLSLINKTWEKYPPADPVSKQNAFIAIGICYRKQHRFDDAQRYLLMAQSLENQNKLVKGGVENFALDYQLGRNYFDIHKADSSKKYLLKILASPVAPKSIKSGSCYGLYLVDSSLGNYKSAMDYLRVYADNADQMVNITENQQISALSIQYHTLEKEKNIELLKSQNMLQKQKEASTRKLFYGGMALLLFVIIMIYVRYYLNAKANRKLAAQKKEINQQYTALQKMNTKQQVLLNDKELLLREIHHRVKNNLQTTMSLLNMQAAHIDNEVALETIRSSQRRMQAMSLIHQKLYQSEKLTSINIATYIEELTSYLRESFFSDNIRFNLDLQPLEFDIAEAIPIGLIVNEAVTNSIKYAFPENRKGTIIILLEKNQLDYKLVIKDDGIGINSVKKNLPKSSLGLTLIEGLTGQLQGSYNIQNNNGTEITITFHKNDFLANGRFDRQ